MQNILIIPNLCLYPKTTKKNLKTDIRWKIFFILLFLSGIVCNTIAHFSTLERICTRNNIYIIIACKRHISLPSSWINASCVSILRFCENFILNISYLCLTLILIVFIVFRYLFKQNLMYVFNPFLEIIQLQNYCFWQISLRRKVNLFV